MSNRTFREPKVNLRKRVRNYSERTTGVNLIVLHSTESHDRSGASDLEGVLSWFDNPKAQASSHIIIDAEGLTARAVDDHKKAWTCAQFNSRSVNVEQIGWSRFSRSRWLLRDPQLKATARWIAYWSRKYEIPIVRGAVKGALVTRPGVVLHSDLGDAGGNHGDPGPGYPLNRVLRWARFYRKAGWLLHQSS